MLSCSEESIFLFFFLLWFEIINESMGRMNTWIAVIFYSLRGCSNLFTLHALYIETLLQNYNLPFLSTHFKFSIQIHIFFFFFFILHSSFFGYNVIICSEYETDTINSYIWFCINCYGPHLFCSFDNFTNQSTTQTDKHQKKCGEW